MRVGLIWYYTIAAGYSFPARYSCNCYESFGTYEGIIVVDFITFFTNINIVNIILFDVIIILIIIIIIIIIMIISIVNVVLLFPL